MCLASLQSLISHLVDSRTSAWEWVLLCKCFCMKKITRERESWIICRKATRKFTRLNLSHSRHYFLLHEIWLQHYKVEKRNYLVVFVHMSHASFMIEKSRHSVVALVANIIASDCRFLVANGVYVPQRLYSLTIGPLLNRAQFFRQIQNPGVRFCSFGIRKLFWHQ